MQSVCGTAKCLYEQILNLHSLVDPNLSKDFYMSRMESFKQLPLLLEDMLFLFGNVAAKVQDLLSTLKPHSLLSLNKPKTDNVHSLHNLCTPHESLPTQLNIQTESDSKPKKFTVTSLGFGETILRERSLNGKPVRRHLAESKESKQSKRPKEQKESKEPKDSKQNKQSKLVTEFTDTKPKTSLKMRKKYSTREDNDNVERRLEEDPYGDQLIYKNSMNSQRLREKIRNPRKRRILSICVKSQHNPHIFIS